MKKVLMISFNYPPLAGMGMLRSLKFAKFLPSFEWEPAVLTIATSKIKATPQTQYWHCDEAEGRLPGVNIIRAKYISLKSPLQYLSQHSPFRQRDERSPNSNVHIPFAPSLYHSMIRDRFKSGLRNFWNTWIEFPDDAIVWYPYAVREALAYLRKNPVDVIFSTALPMTSHLIANSLSKKTGIPWIADFRDAWSQGHYRDGKGHFRYRIDKCMETRTVKSASALTTVSEPLREELLQIHRTFTHKSFVIYNGYDADDYTETEQSAKKQMTITFTGRMYDIDFSSKSRTPAILFQSMALLFQEGRILPDRLHCHIYGEYPLALTKMISDYGLEKVVKCMGAVPFREAIKAQQEADALLLLSWADSDRKGILTGKIFEYLGAKKPILTIPYYNQGIDDILTSTRAGVTVTSVQTCMETLFTWYCDFESKGFVPYHGIPEVIELYSRKKATEQLAAILNQVSQSK